MMTHPQDSHYELHTLKAESRTAVHPLVSCSVTRPGGLLSAISAVWRPISRLRTINVSFYNIVIKKTPDECFVKDTNLLCMVSQIRNSSHSSFSNVYVSNGIPDKYSCWRRICLAFQYISLEFWGVGAGSYVVLKSKLFESCQPV